MSAARGHRHGREDQAAGGPDDGAFNWFKVLDILVWVAVALIVALAAEWFTGLVVREKIARGADKMLAAAAAKKTAAE